MTRALRLRILAALGAAPAVLPACTSVGAVGALADDDDDVDPGDEGGGSGGGSGWDSRVDHDGDGWEVGEDCNDSDPFVYPGAYEQCNGEDDNCDGRIDEGLENYTVFRDADGDGYGDPDDPLESCTWPTGYVGNDLDCDDAAAAVHPGAREVCDQRDNDCDGGVDRVTAYRDLDGDGYAGTAGQWDACDDLPGGVSDTATDCDDSDATISPDAEEVCGDGVDNDCSGYRSCLEFTYMATEGMAQTCRSSWQASYLESWDLVAPGGSFTTYGSWSPIEPWDTACSTPNDEYIELYVEGDAVSLPWGRVGASWTGARLRFDEVLEDDWYAYRFAGELWLDEISEITGEGRPFTVDGRPRVASAGAAAGWTRPTAADAPPAAVRARIAAVWTAAGRAEHASVASFARFALELMALGAPADLLAEASRAMADEVDHARRCFGLAEAIDDAPAGVGPLDVSRALGAAGEPRATLRALLAEGCIGETVAAARAAEAARGATAPAARAALAVIAEDEARHAAYAWRCARWILDRHPELRTMAAEVLARGAPAGPLPEADLDADTLAGWGVLDARARARIERVTWSEVIGPAADALLTRGQRAPL